MTTRYWLVWVDDTPARPEHPLVLDRALEYFRELVDDGEPEETIELKQCTAEDLSWAGIEVDGQLKAEATS